MKKTVTRMLQISGVFQLDVFTLWISDRAIILDLAGWVMPVNENLIEAQVSGEQILVEAFEVACSLGPVTAYVDSIQSRPGVYPGGPHPFRIRSPN